MTPQRNRGPQDAAKHQPSLWDKVVVIFRPSEWQRLRRDPWTRAMEDLAQSDRPTVDIPAVVEAELNALLDDEEDHE